MPESVGFSVRIFLPSGEPEGLGVIEKSNWTGQGLVFPRSLFDDDKVRTREELSRTGVYILWGPSESGQMQRAYVGEGDALLGRIESHAKGKDFWTQAAAFSSKDQNLNKAHIRYLEARLVRLAARAKRCELDNGNVPKIPSLSDADTADAELYLADMLLCLRVVGVNFFEQPLAQSEKTKDLFLNARDIKASGYERLKGFVVRSGSQAAKEEVPSIPPNLSYLRKVLISKGILEDGGPVYRLAQDYEFESPSTASGALLGRSSNGRAEWKDDEERSLKEIQEANLDAP